MFVDFRTNLWWHISAFICKINYANMQEKNCQHARYLFYMQDKYVDNSL